MSDKGNWLKLHRQAIDSAVFADPHLWHMWSWILMRASFQAQHVPMSAGRGAAIVTLRPGQLVTGRHRGASDLGLPESTFRNRLKRLESMGMITIDADTHWSIISITNWLMYQQSDDETRTGITASDGQAKDRHKSNDLVDEIESNDQEEDRLRTGKGQAKDTYKNAKNVKNNTDASLSVSQWVMPEGVNPESWQKWMAHRKKKKAVENPQTWKRFTDEVSLAGWTIPQAVDRCVQGGPKGPWLSFEAKFVDGETKSTRTSSIEELRVQTEKQKTAARAKAQKEYSNAS